MISTATDAKLDRLLKIARLGYRLFPIQVQGKDPLTEEPRVPNACRSASSSLPLIRAWAKDMPDANWGIACGNGLLVLDYDAYKNPDWPGDDGQNADLASHPYIARSARGGLHLFYRIPAGKNLGNSAGKIAKGVDIKVDGGYVVLAGSVTPDGEYTWLEGRELNVPVEELPEPPAWLVELLERKVEEPPASEAWKPGGEAPTGDLSARIRAYLAKVPHHDGAGTGGHNAILKAARAIMGFGVRDESGLSFLAEWNANSTHPAGPESEKQLRHKWAQALKYMANRGNDLLEGRESANWAAETDWMEFCKGDGPAKEEPQAEGQPKSKAPRHSLNPWRINPKPPAWVVPGIFPEGLSVLSADPKCGKSTFLRRVGSDVILGDREFSMSEGRTGSVGWMVAEDPWECPSIPELIAAGLRMEHLDTEAGDGPKFYPYDPDSGGKFNPNEASLKLLEEWIVGHNIRLVVIDCYAKFLEGTNRDASNTGDTREALGPLQELGTRHHCAIVVLTHNSKDREAKGAHKTSGNHQIIATSRCNWQAARSGDLTTIQNAGGNVQGALKSFAFERVPLSSEEFNSVRTYLQGHGKWDPRLDAQPEAFGKVVLRPVPGADKDEAKREDVIRLVVAEFLDTQTGWVRLPVVEAHVLQQTVAHKKISTRELTRARAKLVEDGVLTEITPVGRDRTKWLALTDRAERWGGPPAHHETTGK